MAIVHPSLLAADFGNLKGACELLNKSRASAAHVDIMDGVFVPNISFGPPVMKALQKHLTIPMDVHLMIVDPTRYIKAFAECGARTLNVHLEACPHLHRTINLIRQEGMSAAVTLNPHSPVEMLTEILSEVDMVLLMAVNPGFGGQKFIMNTLNKIKRLRQLIDERGLKTLIEVDGGVDRTTAPLCVEAGADILVAGSFVFKDPNPQGEIEWMANL